MSGSADLCGHKYSTGGTCERETWEDSDRCIWHTATSEKPTAALRDARRDGPERLDDCILTDISLEEPMSFRDCSLENADLSRAELAGSDFSKADLTGSKLTNADLSDAILIRASLHDAIVNNAEFRDIDGIYADFSEVQAWNTEFVRADLRNSNFSEATVTLANMDRVSLHQATLRFTDLRETTIQEAELNWANLYGADLREANLSQSDLFDAHVRWANLERADLTTTDLMGVDFTGARLSGAKFEGAEMDKETEFGDRCIYDPKFVESVSFDDLPEGLTIDDELQRPVDASETYRELENLAKDNALPDIASKYFILRKDLLQIAHRREGRYNMWARTVASSLMVRHGEDPWRVIGTTAIVIGICTMLYPVFGLKTSAGTITYAQSNIGPVRTLLDSFYFSTVTFTTLGYGDVQPLGIARYVAITETLIGSALLALLVFVYGRRATR